jgi:uncharacterized protein YjbI with pentapeptide repeats
MKTIVYLFFACCFVFVTCGCERRVHEEDIREPQFMFHWDAAKQEGRCQNAQGVEGYNPSFIGPCGDLRGYHFQLSTLDGADLRGAVLDGMDLSGFSLNGANLKAVQARGTNFSNTELNGAKLMFGRLEGARFTGASLNGADLHNARLSGSTLKKTSLAGSDFSYSDLGGSKLPSYLATTNMKEAQYTYGTDLPFDEKVANARGMIDSHQKSLERMDLQSEEQGPIRLPSSVEEDLLPKSLASD